jgi:hypothetical protein
MPRATQPRQTRKSVYVDSPVLTVQLEHGLANRQRLPLGDVLTVLEQVRLMVIDIGREIQRDLGVENPAGDFGLELLAGPEGILFSPGSVQAHIAITSNIDNGVLAAHRVVSTINALANKQATVSSEAERAVVRRLNRINKVRERDKTELHLVLKKPGAKKPDEAIFNAAAAATAWSLQAPVFAVEGLTIYGKLFELRDTDPQEDDGAKGFWGELCRDNSETWRVHFHPTLAEKAGGLFRKQVAITGTGKYYRIAAPKLDATNIVPDQERDYEKAFDELFGSDRHIYGDDFDKALKEMRGDD